MPSLEQHKKKYIENKRVLANELNIEKCTCYDWIVTISFYAAVHLVEAEMARMGGLHNFDHVTRNTSIERIDNFKKIRVGYKILYDRSRNARYGEFCLTETAARESIQLLEQIEKEIPIE